ncbi:hypothetical protein EV188_104261 [Actinomycetospora succinea]|uniref:Uncharacterized protein n=1 Tax=Actinomycetospora succinea TaxID=663603 RepID=A0A4R6VD69_9PSEU|nr:hypothetical protein [Actinomycetospora succinea]TDQ58521.1 hypothetical protein EV188_104261 [Actinomycetospora succinea]
MLARVIGTIVIILVLFAIISNPQQSAATTRNGVETLGDVGTSITVFLTSVVNNLAVSTGSRPVGTTYTTTPTGGVETGDGSTPTVR